MHFPASFLGTELEAAAAAEVEALLLLLILKELKSSAFVWWETKNRVKNRVENRALNRKPISLGFDPQFFKILVSKRKQKQKGPGGMKKELSEMAAYIMYEREGGRERVREGVSHHMECETDCNFIFKFLTAIVISFRWVFFPFIYCVGFESKTMGNSFPTKERKNGKYFLEVKFWEADSTAFFK